MNILVCFKVVQELEKVLPSDWQHFKGEPDISYVGNMLGCFDEAALELALRLKDENPEYSCTALTFGKLPSNQCKRIYAAGFDKVICLQSESPEFSPRETAERLAEYIKENPQDIIICGERSPLWDSGTVPYYLAQCLKIPVLSNVTEIKAEGEKILAVTETEKQTCRSLLKPPLLFSVSNTALALRFASLRAQLTAGKKQAEFIDSQDTEKISFRLLEEKPSSCEYLEGSSAELAGMLLKTAQEAGL